MTRRIIVPGPSCHAIAEKLTKMGIKLPREKDVWSQTTVWAILTDEECKEDALLQKTCTPDFLTKSRRRITAKSHSTM